LRKQVSRPARELLAGELEWQFLTARQISKGKIGLCIAAVAAVGAVLLLGVMGKADSAAVAGVFFGAGALLLIAGLGLTNALLKIISGGWNKALTSLAGLGLRNSTRRSGRSLAVVGLLACGIFMVIAVGAFRHNPLAHAQERDSGTGGFNIFGEEGDEASCLNLNRAQMPRLLGLQPDRLQQRGSFTFTKTIEDQGDKKPWNLLNSNLGENVVPAIGDYNTIKWALGKSVGDELDYIDEKGRRFRLLLVGMLKNSILQGSLIISEDEFIKRFPSEDGYRVLLIDAPQDRTEAVAGELSARLKDFGLALTPATQRLAEFNAVENTYLSIFQLLGGLGLLLASVGLGLVVLRNVLERRGELAMLQAVGFDKAELKRMVFYEHGGLLIGGLACGIIAAMVAVSPALKSPGADVPYFLLVLTIAAIAISGIVWIWIATAFALSGKMLDALRNE
jgi:hypothetical protein